MTGNPRPKVTPTSVAWCLGKEWHPEQNQDSRNDCSSEPLTDRPVGGKLSFVQGEFSPVKAVPPAAQTERDESFTAARRTGGPKAPSLLHQGCLALLRSSSSPQAQATLNRWVLHLAETVSNGNSKYKPKNIPGLLCCGYFRCLLVQICNCGPV